LETGDDRGEFYATSFKIFPTADITLNDKYPLYRNISK
jgi:hypothetical protein